ncbi:hypothetical protein [Rhodopirellula bahusiensis]|uniref:hypothetical protein n=1 Tax=Rhodopirellula bahusiensis TaxID=2014065 RepID=UPI00326598AC
MESRTPIGAGGRTASAETVCDTVKESRDDKIRTCDLCTPSARPICINTVFYVPKHSKTRLQPLELSRFVPETCHSDPTYLMDTSGRLSATDHLLVSAFSKRLFRFEITKALQYTELRNLCCCSAKIFTWLNNARTITGTLPQSSRNPESGAAALTQPPHLARSVTIDAWRPTTVIVHDNANQPYLICKLDQSLFETNSQI